MTVTLKPKTEITVPKSIRRKAGIKPGDRFEFKVSGRVINIIPKLSPDELQDNWEIRDPKVRAAIQRGYHEFVAGETRSIALPRKVEFETDAESAPVVGLTPAK
jgi:AbrB family looped-hinge helix DNA binding protein